MAKLSAIEKAIAKLDADIEAIEKKARDKVAVLIAARKRLVETQRSQPKRKPKDVVVDAPAERVVARRAEG